MEAPTKYFDFDSPKEAMNHYASWPQQVPWGLFPCRKCRGQGWEYDPDDPPDPVEGYKLVRRLKCEVCKGQKHSSLSEDKAAFECYIEYHKNSYQQKMTEYEKHNITVESALAKLTADEVSALKREWTQRRF